MHYRISTLLRVCLVSGGFDDDVAPTGGAGDTVMHGRDFGHEPYDVCALTKVCGLINIDSLF